ncbi:MAG: MEKHLA domain-containing protein [Methylococcales bacterium]
MFSKPSAENSFLQGHAAILTNSFYHWTGKNLVGSEFSPTETAYQLFFAPFVVVSHDIAKDPVFNYANQTALSLFGMQWDEFTTMPSRFSGEAINRIERNKLLIRVQDSGYSEGYQGIRVTKEGRRFAISNAVVWNLLDDEGRGVGQAAKFKEWVFL